MTHISMQTPEGLKKVAANEGPDGIDRPMHHSEIIVLQATLIRPADTTAYAAGDAIGAADTAIFEVNFGAAGLRKGFITHARLIREDVGVTAPRFVAHIASTWSAMAASTTGRRSTPSAATARTMRSPSSWRCSAEAGLWRPCAWPPAGSRPAVSTPF